MSPSPTPPRAEIVVDLGAIRHNVARLREAAGDAAMMTVVKADGYGHGMVQVAQAAREAGSQWLGVATLEEAVALREAGDTGRVLCWLAVPGEDYRPAIAADVDVSAYSPAQVGEIARAAAEAGRTARLHIKFDTGLSRGGAARDDWDAVVKAALAEPGIEVVGLWSHFACADEPEHPSNARQLQAFRDAVELAEKAGVEPEVRHLANSAGTLFHPDSHFDLVRCGIASYGLTPAPQVATSPELGLVPAMTVRVSAAMGKDIAAGESVSYGHTWTAPEATHVALVPIGYAEGIIRLASNRAQVQANGERAPIRGRVCMDQFVVEAPGAEAGDEIVVFGAGTSGEPTAQEWADWCETISYEIVTRVGGRLTRRWIP